MRIAILSCLYPFRGGIAQFNAALARELGREHIVKAFNFTTQYPSLLFPGKTQYVTPEDNADNYPSERILSTVNPFTWGKTARAIEEWGEPCDTSHLLGASAKGSTPSRHHRNAQRL